MDIVMLFLMGEELWVDWYSGKIEKCLQQCLCKES